MSDVNAGGQEPQANDGTPDPENKGGGEPQEQTPPWGSEENFDPQRAWTLIQNLREDLDKAKSGRDELAQKVKQYEDASKTKEEKLEESVKGAEERARKAEQEAARLRVALRKGLTETQAKRLVGETEEELEKDADELLASFQDAGGQEPRRRPQEKLRPGAVPSSEPEETDPRKLADRVPQPY